MTTLVIIFGQDVFGYSFPYNRAAAIAYADSYCEDYNIAYFNNVKINKLTKVLEHNVDCANFVTQCLKAGGRDICDPIYDYTPNVFSGYQSSYYSCTKQLVRYLRRIAVESVGDPSILEVGDVIMFKNSVQDTSFFHTAIVVDIQGSDIYYAAHTKDRRHQELLNPTSQIYHYFHILDEYVFFPQWGWGYYYKLMGNWIGPVTSEGFTAAGVFPTNGSEYRGFCQCYVSGIPSNSEVIKTHLRLTINSVHGTNPLELNVNRIQGMSTPSANACAQPPFYIQNENIAEPSGSVHWIDLSQTSAGTDIMEANNGLVDHIFGFGLSDNNLSTWSLYYFYANTEDHLVDAKVKVFVDQWTKDAEINLIESDEVDFSENRLNLRLSSFFADNSIDIHFSGVMPGNNKIRIFDISGRLIKTIEISEGKENITWDLRDDYGNYCSNGSYFIILESENREIVKKFEIFH
ncbi:amidase domain-containing protein [candidate division WOR-3 bacterium]|nr:amidase domain-containing protein [candidate division WOR-3 bacterium]